LTASGQVRLPLEGGKREKEEGKRNYLSTDCVSRVAKAKHLVLFSFMPLPDKN
jgi:hypothetical protein